MHLVHETAYDREQLFNSGKFMVVKMIGHIIDKRMLWR